MKNSTKLISAIFAAVLCGASLAACASDIKPPVTDVTTDTPATVEPITTVITDAPATDTSSETAQTTDAPATDTQAVPTDAPVTTEEPIVTTGAPVTTAPITSAPVTTEAPVTTVPAISAPEEIQAEKIKELLYLTDDGYVKIKGADSIKLPADGLYLCYDKKPSICFFASAIMQTTEQNGDIPFYNGTNSTNKLVTEDGCYFLVFEDGKEKIKLQTDLPVFTSDIDIAEVYYISKKLSYFTVKDEQYNLYLITVHDCGDKIFVSPISNIDDFCYVDSHVGYGVDSNLITTLEAKQQTRPGLIIYKTVTAGQSIEISSVTVAVDKTAGETFPDYIPGVSRLGSASLFYHNGRFFGRISSGAKMPDGTYMWDSGADDPLSILSPGDVSDVCKVVEGLHGENDFDALKPYFENNIGVWSLSVYVGNNSYYAYFLTLDDGKTWSLYDPEEIVPELAKKEISFIEAPKYR